MENEKTFTRHLISPLGTLRLTATDRGLRSVGFVERADGQADDDHPVLERAAGELSEYFAGKRTTFSVPLAAEGTDFQHEVWEHLRTIPPGRTVSYADVARAVGKPRGSQAVGRANGSNPLAIVVPCHRVVGTTGKLTGYAGGVERKQWLLRHEGGTLL